MVILLGLNEEVAQIFKNSQGVEFSYVEVYVRAEQLDGSNRAVVFLLDGYNKRKDWQELRKLLIEKKCICFQYRGILF